MSGQKKWIWNIVASKTDKPSGTIIKFPLKGKPQKEITIDNSDMELRESLMFADHLTEGLVVNLVHNLEDNGINIMDSGCVRDIGFLVELIKSLIHRDMGIEHPMQDMVDLFVTTLKDKTGNRVTSIDMLLLIEIINEAYGDEGEEE